MVFNSKYYLNVYRSCNYHFNIYLSNFYFDIFGEFFFFFGKIKLKDAEPSKHISDLNDPLTS